MNSTMMHHTVMPFKTLNPKTLATKPPSPENIDMSRARNDGE
jgi:hypothetical protein